MEHRKKQRVLVVDDSEDLVESFCQMLNLILEERYVVEGTTSPTKAIEMHKERDYDHVFIDLVMPEMDGTTLAKNLRNGTGPKIYFISGALDVSVYQHALALGIPVQGFFAKPTPVGQLEQLLPGLMQTQLMRSHVRFIPRYDTKQGFLFIREQDQKGNESRNWKLVGGEHSMLDETLDWRVSLEIHEEVIGQNLGNKVSDIKPFTKVHEPDVITHYYTGLLEEAPKRTFLVDPQKRGFIYDENGKITKRIAYFNESQIRKRVGNTDDQILGHIYPGAIRGIADYKRFQSEPVVQNMTLGDEQVAYIERKTGVSLNPEAQIYSWIYHQRQKAPKSREALGAILIKTSHMWHVVRNRIIPVDPDERSRYLRYFCQGELDDKLKKMVYSYIKPKQWAND